jgi:hypothetical protein
VIAVTLLNMTSGEIAAAKAAAQVAAKVLAEDHTVKKELVEAAKATPPSKQPQTRARSIAVRQRMMLNLYLARQCLERGLIDEFHVHLARAMLGDGIRLLDAPGIDPVRWERMVDPDSGAQVLDLRYRPV